MVCPEGTDCTGVALMMNEHAYIWLALNKCFCKLMFILFIIVVKIGSTIIASYHVKINSYGLR